MLAAATSAGQVKVDRRIANRMYVRVSGDLQPLLTISSFSGTYHSGLNPFDGSITVAATITNSGNVALEGSSTLSTTTWFGSAWARRSGWSSPRSSPATPRR